MAIEIRELVIRARVDPDEERPTADEKRPRIRHRESERRLVQSCVREVMRILQDQRER